MHPGFPFRPIVLATATLLGLASGPARAEDTAGLGPFLEAVRDAFHAVRATTGGPGLVWNSLAEASVQATEPRDDASPSSDREAQPLRHTALSPPPRATAPPPPAAMTRLARINGLTVETLPGEGAAFGYAAPAGDTPGDVLTGARFAATVQTGGVTWEVARNLSPAEDFGLTRRNRETLAAFSNPAAFRSPWLAWTGEGQSVALAAPAPTPGNGRLRITGFSSTADPDMSRPTLDVLAAEWTQPLSDDVRLGVQAGRLRDGDDVIVSRRTEVALADPAPTRFAGLSMDAALAGGVVLAASLHSGWTKPHLAGDAALGSVSTLRSDSATLAVIGHGLIAGGDHFGLAAQQPLRVDAGTGRLKATGDEVSLAAEGREIDVQAFYGVPTGEDSRLDAKVTLRRDPGHDRLAETETTGSLRWRMVF